MRVDEGFQAIGHVVEIKDKSLKFVSLAGPFFAFGCFDAGVQVAAGKLPGCDAQVADGAGNEDGDERCDEKGDDEGDGQAGEHFAVGDVDVFGVSAVHEVDVFLAMAVSDVHALDVAVVKVLRQEETVLVFLGEQWRVRLEVDLAAEDGTVGADENGGTLGLGEAFEGKYAGDGEQGRAAALVIGVELLPGVGFHQRKG